jgi:hypothetical protein
VNVSSFCLLRALQNVFELARACRRELLFMVLELLLGRVAADSIDTGPAVFALGSGNHNTDALQDPATWLRQLMGVESHLSTRSGPSGGASSPFVSARGGEELVRTLVGLEVQGAAQNTKPFLSDGSWLSQATSQSDRRAIEPVG